MANDHIALSMAGLTTFGSVVAYARTRSKLSVGFGLAFSALFGTAAYQIRQGEYLLGHEISLGGSLVFGAIMLRRYVKTMKAFPGAVFASASAVAAFFEARSVRRLRALGW